MIKNNNCVYLYTVYVFIITLIVAVWTYHVESKHSAIATRLTQIEKFIEPGILPLTQEKIRVLLADQDRIRSEVDTLRIALESARLEIARTRLGNIAVITKRK